MPFLVVHGTADNVLPIHLRRASRDVLSALPVQLDYREYPMRHEITQPSLGDVTAWLSSRLDGAHPGTT